MHDSLNKYFSSLISLFIHSLFIFSLYFIAVHTPSKNGELIEFSFNGGSGGEDNSIIDKNEDAIAPKQLSDEFINTEKKNLTKDRLSVRTKESGTGTGTGDGTGTGNSSGVSIGLPSMPKPKVEEIYLVAVDEMPEPVGGIQKIISQVVYPAEAKKNGITGTVFVLAFVDEMGSVRKVLLTKGIGYGCDEAAMNAVSRTRFKPGKQNGIPVKVQVQVPVAIR